MRKTEVAGTNAEFVPALMKAINDCGDTPRVIEEEVEILLLRHVIPGQCNLYPVAWVLRPPFLARRRTVSIRPES